MPKCKFCQEPIKWKFKYKEVPTGEKNLPLNMDGSLHDCRPKTEYLLKQPRSLTPAEVDEFSKDIPWHDPTPSLNQAILTELTKHTHLLQEILEAVKK